MTVKMISAHAAHELMWTDPAVVLVGAYDRESDFQQNMLEGAISLQEFRQRKESIAKDETIIFYGGVEDDDAATAQALDHLRQGFTNVHVLRGGVYAWTNSGYGMATAGT